MASKLQNFTSTGAKILHHPDAVKDLQSGKNHPIVLHIMPTERCNLQCTFCSVAHRGINGKLHPDLKISLIMRVVCDLIPLGLKAVIISGGGEPTLYKYINLLMEMLFRENLQVGVITNGLYFNETVSHENRMKLSWVRISANTLDQRESLPLPILGPDTTLGLSYILNYETTFETLKRIAALVEVGAVENKPISYIRMLPDCNLPDKELEAAHAKVAELVEMLGEPFFHQVKLHRTPKDCHLGRVHPVLYTDGNIYPCDSLVLNSPSHDKRFHSEFALCSGWDAKEFYEKSIPKYCEDSLVDTSKCHNCVFADQNVLLEEIINGEELPDPIEGLQHINFI